MSKQVRFADEVETHFVGEEEREHEEEEEEKKPRIVRTCCGECGVLVPNDYLFEHIVRVHKRVPNDSRSIATPTNEVLAAGLQQEIDELYRERAYCSICGDFVLKDILFKHIVLKHGRIPEITDDVREPAAEVLVRLRPQMHQITADFLKQERRQ